MFPKVSATLLFSKSKMIAGRSAECNLYSAERPALILLLEINTVPALPGNSDAIGTGKLCNSGPRSETFTFQYKLAKMLYCPNFSNDLCQSCRTVPINPISPMFLQLWAGGWIGGRGQAHRCENIGVIGFIGTVLQF